MWKSKLVVLVKCAMYITLCTSIAWLLFSTPPSTLVDSSYPPTLICKHNFEDCTIANFTCPATPPSEWKYPREGWQLISYWFVFLVAYFVYYIILHDWGILIGKGKEMMGSKTLFELRERYESLIDVTAKFCCGLLATCLFIIFIAPVMCLLSFICVIIRFLLFGLPSPFKFSYLGAILSLGMLLMYTFIFCGTFFGISIASDIFFSDESNQTPDCYCSCGYPLINK
eukprot:TRINITY_DN4338_c0_g3_i2.p1 TRINITY_DN4338_c0_g3~~TRINITY_DN4338_c0_g3_i2.p1  ORF type:complete len:227 (+),score=19.11 TRINITY_DN4338_c0_g3_i2:186-866(+)